MESDQTQKPKPSNWPTEPFAWSELFQQHWWVIVLLIAILGSLLLVPLRTCRSGPAVVVYAAQDQVYAEPILHQFTRETGVPVRTVYDSEAVKTVGLANRLLGERDHPQCDVFWGNEELRTRQLAAQEVFRETNGWAAFGFRSRRIVVNTNRVSALNASTPLSLLALTNAEWKGKVALAYPMFGTTSTHFLALRSYWGESNWLRWCQALEANQPFLVDGNSVVVQFVGRGEASIGLTDSDDIAVGENNGLPVVGLPMTQETLLIPNTVAVIRGAPHPELAERLFQYLQQREVGEKLMAAQALEGWNPGLRPHLQPDWRAILKDLDTATAQLKSIFLR